MSKNAKGKKAVSTMAVPKKSKEDRETAELTQGTVPSPGGQTQNQNQTQGHTGGVSRSDVKSSAMDKMKKAGSKEPEKKGAFRVGDSIKGNKKTYSVTRVVRNSVTKGEYFVKDDEENAYSMRCEPKGKSRLKNSMRILAKLKDKSGERFLPVIEHGTTRRINYLITEPVGIRLYEVHKYLRRLLTAGCAFNIAIQTFEAIRVLHEAGFVHRNIGPSSFSIGYEEKETQIYLTDFRIARDHIVNDKVVEARKSVPWLGTLRYTSIAALKEQDQGRKDDLESWVYMVFDFFDIENGTPWKRLSRDKVLESKEALKTHALPNVYKRIPEEFKSILELIHSYKYEDEPDYNSIMSRLMKVATDNSYNLSTCDWMGRLWPKQQAQAISAAIDKSADNRCSGIDDLAVKKKMKRQQLKPNDVIKNDKFIWKVVSILGGGGFGDVYKVFNDNAKAPATPPTVNNNNEKQKMYALKTEIEEGTQVSMLRLKVEVQVLCAIQENRKSTKKPFRHFLEIIDRGKSDELKCKFIVMNLVGPSLDDMRKKHKLDLSAKSNPYIIAHQTLESIQELHEIGFLHRDIKPANFSIGIGPDESNITMLDFGICRKYLDEKNKHRTPRVTVKFLGTPRFASRNQMKCSDLARKDDLESWLYMLLDIMDAEKGITWKGISDKNQVLDLKEILFKKKELPEKIHKKWKSVMDYVNGLAYEAEPNYSNIQSMIKEMATATGTSISPKMADWVGKIKEVPNENKLSSASESSGTQSAEENLVI